MWYYINKGQRQGPINDLQINHFVKNGVITVSTKVWCKGMQDWKSAGETDLIKHFQPIKTTVSSENTNCPNCGSHLDSKVIYCGNCGTKVKGNSIPSKKLLESETTINVGYQTNHTNVVIASNKNVAVAIILTFLFGPLGMLYSTVSGGIIMFFISLVVAFITLGFGLIITWPICIIWGAMAANNFNKNLIVQYK